MPVCGDKEETPMQNLIATARILVVDDDEAVCRLIGRVLTNSGHQCDLAFSGEQALEQIGHAEYHLVLSDISMPGTSGVDLLIAVQQQYPDLPFVMMTGSEKDETALEAINRGAYACIIKPCEPSQVVISVANALRQRNLEIENRTYRHQLEERVRDQIDQIHASQNEIAMRLVAASDYRDGEMGQHTRRIWHYAELLCAQMGHAKEDQSLMGMAASMHDIGKVGIPDVILRKPSRLSSEEFEVMKTHTTIGAQILASDGHIPLLKMSRDIALFHHERWDGSGYPQGLKDTQIPLPARIVAVADVFDALTHSRPYKAAWPEDIAIQEMQRERGRHFDPDVLDIFEANLPIIREIRTSNPDPE